MGDVLTKEERRAIEKLRSDLKGGNKRGAILVAVIDRICARLERLKAVETAAWNFRAVVGRLHVPKREWDALESALSALKEEGK